ncbi:unnamed protein product [Ixodes persulcatus]
MSSTRSSSPTSRNSSTSRLTLGSGRSTSYSTSRTRRMSSTRLTGRPGCTGRDCHPRFPGKHRAEFTQCEDLCKRWADPDADESEFSSRDVADFKPRHTELFLSFLLREKPLSSKRIALLTQLYKMEQVTNSEIKFRWLRLGLCAKWEPIVPHVTKFLREVGRMKFVCPLFRDLHAWEDQRPLSTSLFLELKPRMMHVVVCKLAKDLAISS